MDEIEDILRQLAYDDATGWTVTTNSFVTRVEAQTAATFSTSGEAFSGADRLVAALLELGYEQRQYTEVGAIAISGDEPETLLWRGKITLIIRSRLLEGL